jgi:hypothetical protein
MVANDPFRSAERFLTKELNQQFLGSFGVITLAQPADGDGHFCSIRACGIRVCCTKQSDLSQ